MSTSALGPQHPGAQTIEQWIAAAHDGSDEALGKLLDSCRRYLLLVANRELTSDVRAKGGASDLVQETFLDAWGDFHCFQGRTEAELLAWLRRILLDNLSNFTRRYRRTKKRRVSREVSLRTGESAAGLALEPAAASESPSGHAIAEESAAVLRRALARLPEHYRQVVRLRSWERQSFAEVGRAMNCSSEAARKLWSRAVERLQREFESHHESG